MAYVPTYHDLTIPFAGPTSSGNATVHYIEAGSPYLPNIILWHGFPSSSAQYNAFIPMLSDAYHVLAPDMPGFGQTAVADDFDYTFDNLAAVSGSWLDAMNLTDYAFYIFDYGAPVALRIALNHTTQVNALISQNGNAYTAGFGQTFWAPIFALWNTSDSSSARAVVQNAVLTLPATISQYLTGTPASLIPLLNPVAWTLDYLQNLASPSNISHQLDLFYDYRTNVQMYPKFQEYFRTSKVPILAVWGKNDPAFVPAGAEAFKGDSPGAEVRFVDAGHFALECRRWEVARIVREWLSRVGV